jgi:uncharacterized protein YbcI
MGEEFTMSRKEHAFNDVVRKIRKEMFGKGPERIRTVFIENMAISTMHGNLTATEKFIAQSPGGEDLIHKARTKMIQEEYKKKVPDGLEEIVGSKFIRLFSDIDIKDDVAVSVFYFEDNIEG